MDVNDVTDAAKGRKHVDTAKETISQGKNKPEQSIISSRQVQDDNVTISPAAKEKSKIAKYVEIVNKMPEVREDEIARVKNKMEKGEYSSPDVLKKTAEKMLEE